MIPRIVVAGTASGAGKTSIACGLIGALRGRGLVVQGFKVGPDYIDPSYHALASGRPGRNLDAFLSGPDLIAPLLRHGGAGADIAVIEGVMGLFDGASGRGELASTAHVAKLLRAPVILVVDASAMARSAAAIVHGYTTFDPAVDVAGVIYNKVGSDHHEELLREATAPLGIPVLGAVRRDERVVAPERHLGLVPADEREARARAALDALAEATARSVDLVAVERLARAAPVIDGPAWDPGRADGAARTRIAIARGPAFSFHYTENLELLDGRRRRARAVRPAARRGAARGRRGARAGRWLSGGLRRRARGERGAARGRPRLRRLRPSGAGRMRRRPVPVRRSRRPRDVRRAARARAHGRAPHARLPGGGRGHPDALDRGGQRVRGHEFHYSAVEATGAAAAPAWSLTARGTTRDEGLVAGGVQASYLHVHWAAHPELARRFARAAAAPALAA